MPIIMVLHALMASISSQEYITHNGGDPFGPIRAGRCRRVNKILDRMDAIAEENPRGFPEAVHNAFQQLMEKLRSELRRHTRHLRQAQGEREQQRKQQPQRGL